MGRKLLLAGLLSATLLAACGQPTDNTSTGSQNAQPTVAAAFDQNQPTSAAVPTPEMVPTAAAPAPTAPSRENGTNNQQMSNGKQYSAAPAMQIDQNKSYTAVIETSRGSMTVELYAKDAPKTVNNFVFLAREGFYQNIKFHRIIKDFMVQTGDPLGTGTGGPGYRFEDETVTREYTRGTLAMANAGPNTNGSQFFIVHADYPLPKAYTIFGKVTSGLEVLDAIATVPTTGQEGSTPLEDVRIVNITITEQ